MDTTAAAELGMGDPEGGAAFWHSGNPGPDHWGDPGDDAYLLDEDDNDDDDDDDDDDDGDDDLAWDCPAPAAAVPALPSGGLARGARAPAVEPPPKLLRSIPDANHGVPLHPSFSGHGAGPLLGRGNSSAAALPHFGSAAAAAAGSSPSGAGAVGRGRGMGSIFYKTKLCSRFRSGNCPYNTNCNFAHGMEELRKPPPGWEEFVASQELPPPVPSQGGAGGVGAAVGSTDSQVRFHKTRPCKKYFGEGNCPYGEKCNFLHDEQSAPRVVREAREAAVAANNAGAGGVVAASPRLETHPLVPPTNGHLKEKGSGGDGGGGSTSAGSAPPNARPSNWKTRLCNKWETTGYCPCGDKCHFAHGSDELQRYGGGLPYANAHAFSDSKSGCATSRDLSWHQRQHAGGAFSAQSGSKENSNWRGPSDISTIYGDWWVEDDYWQCGATPASHESTELEGDVWSEAQRPTPLLAPASSTPKPVSFFRRTTY